MQIENITQNENTTTVTANNCIIEVSNEDASIISVTQRWEGIMAPTLTVNQQFDVIEAVQEDWASEPQIAHVVENEDVVEIEEEVREPKIKLTPRQQRKPIGYGQMMRRRAERRNGRRAERSPLVAAVFADLNEVEEMNRKNR